MDYKLSGKETVGVIAVGLAASEVARRVSNAQKTPKSHQVAMLATGAALYFAGVYIGTNRPAGGYMGLAVHPDPTHPSRGSASKKGSCNVCGSPNKHSCGHN